MQFMGNWHGFPYLLYACVGFFSQIAHEIVRKQKLEDRTRGKTTAFDK